MFGPLLGSMMMGAVSGGRKRARSAASVFGGRATPRRRGGLNARKRRDLLWIKDNLGKTAAAAYMRGRGW